MIKHRAQINATDRNGATPLHAAALNRSGDSIVKYLIDCQASVNSKDIAGQTPLHWAADNNCIENVKILLQCNADRTALTNYWQTPLALARERQKKSEEI